jgi:hypothetical protein
LGLAVPDLLLVPEVNDLMPFMTFIWKLLLAFFMTGFLAGCGKQEADAPPPATAPAAVVNPTNLPGVAATGSAAFAKLTGKWVRPDGGYVLEIRSVAPDGKLDAGYFNPKSIHVARAVATVAGERLKVFVELRDVNYPGSTYTLTYDPSQDQLTGDYFQAVARETYDVFFKRMKP